MKMIKWLVVAAAVAAGMPVAAAKERKIEMEEVPERVRTALDGFIAKKAKGATVAEIEVEREGKRKVYEFELKLPNGAEWEVEISAKGKILEVEREEDDDDDGREGEDDDDGRGD